MKQVYYTVMGFWLYVYIYIYICIYVYINISQTLQKRPKSEKHFHILQEKGALEGYNTERVLRAGQLIHIT